ncbi:MAG: acyl carrier protein [Parvibaculum sp.]|nr:acyl carrier protein [Parvibaculum sp.]
MTRDDIEAKLREFLIELFEVSPNDISESALLSEDLDLDSIDAVDLILKLQEFTGRKVSSEQFRTVRTVGDVIDQVHALLSQAA